MTDYLELLLERRREEDEEKESLRLDAEEAAVFAQKGAAKNGQDTPRQDRTEWEGLPKLSGGWGTYLPGTAMGERGTETPQRFGTALARAGEAGSAPRRGTATAWNALEEALGRVGDTLGGAEAERRRSALFGLPGGDAGLPSGGAAELAGRLSWAALASAAAVPVTRRAVFDEGTREGVPTADWEEFDRRLERDARRYDGGLGVY